MGNLVDLILNDVIEADTEGQLEFLFDLNVQEGLS